MSQIFLRIINMSISASYIVLAVLLLRLLLKKAPKWLIVALWGIVAVRLICPFSVESVLSLIPSAETVSPTIMTDPSPQIHTGISVLNQTLNPVIATSCTPSPEASTNPLQIWIPALTGLWIAGTVMLLIYAVVSYGRLKHRIGTAVPNGDNIYRSESIVSPFVLGIIKPKIYLPCGITEQDMVHVIAHEKAHIRRMDHLWKPLGFLLLAIHWFNPFVWLGYILLCRDIELACDEKVIKELDRDARADYSETLLTCSVNRRMISACPLAFGEVSVKNRIKSVLHYKKPAFWIIVAAIVACVVTAVCFLTNPPSKTNDDTSPDVIKTDYEGVYITLASVEPDTDANWPKTFHVVWHNETEKEITFGPAFLIQYKTDEKWTTVSSPLLSSTYLYDKEWVSPFLDIDIHTAIIDEKLFPHQLKPHTTKAQSYSVGLYDFSKPGMYRLLVLFRLKEGDEYLTYNTWVEFTVEAKPDTEFLREHYPEYVDLDTSEGFDIYVFQFAPEHYSFALQSRATQQPPIPYFQMGLDLSSLREILSAYHATEEDVRIIPSTHPLSSYVGSVHLYKEGEDVDAKNAAYTEKILEMLFGEG